MSFRSFIAFFVFAWIVPTTNAATTAPKVVKSYPPQIPFAAYKENLAGSATVEFVIQEDGTVAKIKVVKASREDFGRSAVECISKWQFTPGEKDGQKIRVRAQQSFDFPAAEKKTNKSPEPTAHERGSS